MATQPMPDAGRRTLTRRVISIVLPIGVLALLAFVGRKYFGELHRLVDASPPLVAIMVAAFVAARIIYALVVKLALERLRHHVGLWELYLLTHIMSYANLFLPRVGLGAPALYLKFKHNISYAVFGSLFLPALVLHVAAAGLIGLVCQAILWRTTPEIVDYRITALFECVLLAGLGAALIRVPIPARFQGRIAQFARRLMDAWKTLGTTWDLIGKILGLRVAFLLVNAARLYAGFRAIDVDVSFTGVVIASLLADLSMLVAITPAGLGLREAVVAFSAHVLGVEPSAALSVAILDRLVMTLCVIVLAQVGTWRLIRPLNRGPVPTVAPQGE